MLLINEGESIEMIGACVSEANKCSN